MSISKTDLSELRRIATNTYDGEKAFMNRVIKGIGSLETENSKLRAEIEVLRIQLNKKV